MDWLILTGISIVFRSVYGLMTKVLSDKLKVSAYTQAMLLPAAAAVIALLASPLLGGLSLDFGHVSVIAIALVVFGQGLGNIVYFEAMKSLTSSTAQITFSSILFFNTILSLMFLGLSLSPLNIVGIVILALAIVSVSTGKIVLNKRGVLLMLFAAFLFAVFQLSSAELSKQVSAATYLVVAYTGAALVVFILKSRVVWKELHEMTDYKTTLGIPFLTALPSVGNFLFAYYAYRSAPNPAKVALLLTSQVVLTVFLSYIFLKENDHLGRKVLASVLVIVAAILIKG